LAASVAGEINQLWPTATCQHADWSFSWDSRKCLKNHTFARLAAQWLPYYDDPRRERRLAAAIGFARNNLAHVPLYVHRGLYFQAFHRLYHAFQEFLQALFIARRTYPIAYDKWIREQVEDTLGLPQLYRELPRLFEYRQFDSDELATKAATLDRLLSEYTSPEGGGSRHDLGSVGDRERPTCG